MPKRSDDIQVDVADLKSEIRAIEQSVEVAKARFDESVRRANDAVEQLGEEVSSTSHGTSGAPGRNDLVERLEKAQRNAARVEQEGSESLARFRKQADVSLAKLRRQLKLVEEKLAERR